MQIPKMYWLKFGVILLYLASVYFILHVYHIDYARIKDIDPDILRGQVKALGVWASIIYVLFYVLRPLILFPATILSMLGGVIFGYFWGMIFVLLGAMFSAVIEFVMSRYFCRNLVIGLIGDSNLSRIDKTIQKYGFRTVFLIRLIPNVAFDIQNFSLGLTNVKLKDYLFATLLGIIPISFAYVYLGYALFDFKCFIKPAFILVVGIGIYFIQKYFRRLYFKRKPYL